MNKLDYSISLRAKGLGAEEIKKKMEEKGFDDSEIQYYLKKSDEIFLDQSIHYKGLKSRGTNKNTLRMISLVLTLLLLFSVFFGYVRIGLLGLVILWSIVGIVTRRS
ncbi:hypothetical protein EZV76_05235 [Flagellimonas alvinocaridis]|uniref:Uncharacterized protein n=1 Tax=Flagellimonas alvinocaridis TaxID=2530200 RepID=A0A4S8RS61_9FLAO|nr:hypothetical protein [Allomuricauda alvinocaridis]THV59965.1 hypothetical protein EZV76_05235 [Allomuricauda alvinocaridis]